MAKSWANNDYPLFEAFGPGMVSLGTIGPFEIGDGNFFGGTAEDRFFGVQHPSGVEAIKIFSTPGAIEVDHVQFGIAPPLNNVAVPTVSPAGLLVLTGVLVMTGLLGLASYRRGRAVRG